MRIIVQFLKHLLREILEEFGESCFPLVGLKMFLGWKSSELWRSRLWENCLGSGRFFALIHSEFVRERLQEWDFHGCVYSAASPVKEHRLGSSEFLAMLLNVGMVKGPQAEFSPGGAETHQQMILLPESPLLVSDGDHISNYKKTYAVNQRPQMTEFDYFLVSKILAIHQRKK